jgi:isopentenyl-diphosphate delta-isomerase
VSSMTGGTKLAKTINSNLARVCAEFGIGMGLGSCRILLDDDTHLGDFDVRDLIGDDLPFYANLGIAQVEKMIAARELDKITVLIDKLRADGLIIHVNPFQEWFQPEGDRLLKPPIDSIKSVLDHFDFPVVVKEVGQGMGPASLLELLKLPLQAIEFAAYGGTNFAKVELLRSDEMKQQLFEPLAYVGHNAEEMTEIVNRIVREETKVACKEIIVSGGIKSFLQGYYLVQKCLLPAIYGQASSFLKYAKESYDDLYQYVDYQVRGIKLASVYLSVKDTP